MFTPEVAASWTSLRVMGTASVVVAVSLLTGCAGSPSPHSASPAASSPSGVAGPGGSPGNPDVALCRTYLAAVGDARAPVPAMRTEAVLVPAVDFIELGTNQIATRGSAARTPAVAAAMREVVAAQEDLDAQGRTKLPAGADLNATTVRLNPDRLVAALDTAELACKPLLAPGPKPS